jgi:hypothetical protein
MFLEIKGIQLKEQNPTKHMHLLPNFTGFASHLLLYTTFKALPLFIKDADTSEDSSCIALFDL